MKYLLAFIRFVCKATFLPLFVAFLLISPLMLMSEAQSPDFCGCLPCGGYAYPVIHNGDPSPIEKYEIQQKAWNNHRERMRPLLGY